MSELDNRLMLDKENLDLKFFINYSFIKSQYLKSEQVGIEGNSVEFVPKTQLLFLANIIIGQFTDSSNAIDGNLSGVIGQIVIDMSIFKKKKLENESE